MNLGGGSDVKAAKDLVHAGHAFDDGEIANDENGAATPGFERKVGSFEGIHSSEETQTEADIVETVADLDTGRHRTVDNHE